MRSIFSKLLPGLSRPSPITRKVQTLREEIWDRPPFPPFGLWNLVLTGVSRTVCARYGARGRSNRGGTGPYNNGGTKAVVSIIPGSNHRFRDRGATLRLGGAPLVTEYWGGCTRHFFLLTLYNFKNIGGGGTFHTCPPYSAVPEVSEVRLILLKNEIYISTRIHFA